MQVGAKLCVKDFKGVTPYAVKLHLPRNLIFNTEISSVDKAYKKRGTTFVPDTFNWMAKNEFEIQPGFEPGSSECWSDALTN